MADVLTRDEVVELIQKYRLGRKVRAMTSEELEIEGLDPEAARRLIREGEAALETLVTRNDGLVYRVANKHVAGLRSGLELDDLVQAGRSGLIRAIQKFDESKGTQFSTYAMWWIRQSVGREIADHARSRRLPVHVEDKIAKIKQAFSLLQQEVGRVPTNEEVARYLAALQEERARATGKRLEDILQSDGRWTAKRVATLRRLDAVHGDEIRLDSPVNEHDSNGEAREEYGYAAEERRPALDEMDRERVREALYRAAQIVIPTNTKQRLRAIKIVELRYGLRDGNAHTLEEVGQKYGLTRERIRQIEKPILRRMAKDPALREIACESLGYSFRTRNIANRQH